MSRTYGIVNLISSLGFTYTWRRQAVFAIPSRSGRVADLMTGGAECLAHLKRRVADGACFELIDWCGQMCERAGATVARSRLKNCRVLNCSALRLPVEDNRYDALISTFGLKTLSEGDLVLLAREMKRVLRPSGCFSFLEFSLPPDRFIRFFFRLYVKFHVPLVGWIFLAIMTTTGCSGATRGSSARAAGRCAYSRRRDSQLSSKVISSEVPPI